jgi:hypothetical protein
VAAVTLLMLRDSGCKKAKLQALSVLVVADCGIWVLARSVTAKFIQASTVFMQLFWLAVSCGAE